MVQHWIKCSGTSAHPLDVDDWMPRHRAWRREHGPISAFPRRPRVQAPRLSLAPELRDIRVIARSLSQHSHIRLTREQGELAEELIRAAADEAAVRPPIPPDP